MALDLGTGELSTGAAEPRTLVKHLMAARSAKLQDLELIQIVSFADAISMKNALAKDKTTVKAKIFRKERFQIITLHLK